MPQNLRRGRSEAVPGRKMHLFRRGMGYHPPPGQENAPQPARKVPRGSSGQENAPKPAQRALQRHLGQKKVSFPARNGIPPASRAGKCPSTCAEGAPRRFRAEIGIISGAEWDTHRLPKGLPPFVHFVVVFFVVAGGDVVHPLLVFKVPADGLLNTLLKLERRFPAQFTL